MDKNPIRWLTLFAFLFGSGTCGAQVDVEALQAAKDLATLTFFDDTEDVQIRLDAVAHMGYPETETFDRLLEVATTTSENEHIRLAAMKRYRYDDRYIDTALTIIADADESELLASELIYDIARRTTFRQPAEIRQALQAALRERLDDERDLVRLAAYRSLVSSHDVVAIDRIVDGVRDGDPPIPMADAIELLDTDGPTRHVQTVRPFIGDPDPAVQGQAARVLAVDPDSRQGVVDLAFDPETPRDVRLHALRALSREDAGFFSYAIRLISNRQEDPDVRYAAMAGGMARLNYHDVSAELQISYARAIDGVARNAGGQITSDDKNLAAEAKQLVAHLRKYFPAIGKDFARR